MTTHLDIEKGLRKQFEEAYAAAQMPAESDWFRLESDGDYFYTHTASAWEGYQLGLAARSASLPPMRGTDSQQDAGAVALSDAEIIHAMCAVGLSRGNITDYITFARAVEEKLASRCRAQGGITQPETAARASLQADEGKDGEPIVINSKAPGDLKIGDYVFASRWSDCDPGDPWAVGRITELGTRSVMVGDISPRHWPNAMRISEEQGRRIIESYPDIEKNWTATNYEAIARVFGIECAAIAANEGNPAV